MKIFLLIALPLLPQIALAGTDDFGLGEWVLVFIPALFLFIFLVLANTFIGGKQMLRGYLRETRNAKGQDPISSLSEKPSSSRLVLTYTALFTYFIGTALLCYLFYIKLAETDIEDTGLGAITNLLIALGITAVGPYGVNQYQKKSENQTLSK